MIIGGFLENSIIEWPGHIVFIVYTGGCNFRCPFCHNYSLVTGQYAIYDEDKIFEEIEKRTGFIDAVEITGGEPTLQPDLEEFIEKIKEMGLSVKLDTNGSNPDIINKLLKKDLLDYIAMDIKTSLIPERYQKATGINVDMSTIRESINIIKTHARDYEFRTTVVPGIVERNDIENICKTIDGARRYVLQQFNPENVLDKRYSEVEPYKKEVLLEYQSLCNDNIKEVIIKNL